MSTKMMDLEINSILSLSIHVVIPGTTLILAAPRSEDWLKMSRDKRYIYYLYNNT